MSRVKALSDLANEILDAQWNVTHFEALQLAAQILHTGNLTATIEAAFSVNNVGAPPALEAIAMELGAANTGGTIKDALFDIAENMKD